MTELIITEKPSAANKIAYALGDKIPEKKYINKIPYYEIKSKNILVGCAVGHLFSLTEKKKLKSLNYPSFDIEWKPNYEVKKKLDYSRKYLNALKTLSKKCNKFTVATDYDIEGEVIGLNIIRFICKKKDANRMKFSTLTVPDLKESYKNKLEHLDWGQAYAGETRHFLDWLYGINISRALMHAIKKAGYFKILSTGRVQGPALKMVVEREREIEKFIPEPFWQLQLLGKIKKDKIEAWHEKDKFKDKKEVLKIKRKVEKSKEGMVDEVEKKEYLQYPLFPFDLTTLQTESYKLFNINPKETLQIAQDLYINGYISYPRTSSQQLPKSIGYKKIISNLKKQDVYKKLAEKLLAKKYLKPNEGKKTDPAHPAIYPTGIIPKLDKRSFKIYDLIARRFMTCFGENAKRESMKIKINVKDEIFISEGKRTIEKGWHIFYEPYIKYKEHNMPEVEKGEKVKIDDIIKHDKETQPPKRYTQSSIIQELEKRNLGTKATRAHIIDSLYQREYVYGTPIKPAEIGIETIKILEKYSDEIIDEKLTSYFEEEMEKIRNKEEKEENIIKEAKKRLTAILKKFREKEDKIGKELKKAYYETENKKNLVGKCPKCKKGNLMIRYSHKTKKEFIACDNPDCDLILNLPQNGKIYTTKKICPKCSYPIIGIAKKRKKQEICLNPECKNKEIKDKEAKKEMEEIEKGEIEKKCPECGGKLVVRESVYGKFYGCSNFPKCKHTESIDNNHNNNNNHKKNNKT